jgi:M6 family metalloprotease-like protein
MPTLALADFADTIHCLVLRYDFQYETVDDPNTTGRGTMNLAEIGASDSAAYYDSVGHWVDPPPRNTYYFDAHLNALRIYLETISAGKVTLDWKIFPEDTNATYVLPQPMSYYGACYVGLPADEAFAAVIRGLENYFEDGLRVADSVSPEIDFSAYDSYFMFHAGSDQQNDIGFPVTCSDMFTGYISYYDTVWVDDGATGITDAMMMPETMSQDNRATAMNATVAHEFGHQLGLPDLYRTDNFVSCLGDFALMDYNGFGTAVDFGWKVGRVFGALPVYPCAWSRAYLGFEEVHDFRTGTEIAIVAAAIAADGIKIARVPISENEYYLIENRAVELDGYPTNMRADFRTSVFQYPARNMGDGTYEPSGEYDFLIPGSGLLIYLVDEGVAYLNNDYYTGDTVINFNDNKVQWALGDPNPTRKFISLVEADGVIDLSGYYQTYGDYRYGWEGDMFREDRNSSFTANTNPAAIDNSGNNTHVRIDRIARALIESGGRLKRTDSVITFDLETELLSPGFPVRAGASVIPLSPVVDDLNGDGNPEIIIAAGRNLCVVGADGQSFIQQVSGCDPCVEFADTATATVHPGQGHPLPLYYRTSEAISANPVTGDFDRDMNRLVAVGFSSGPYGRVELLEAADADGNGLADLGGASTVLHSLPIAMVFGSSLYILTNNGEVHLKTEPWGATALVADLDEDEYYGMVRLGDAVVVLAGDTAEPAQTRVHYIRDGFMGTTVLDHRYNLGPVLTDLDGDDNPELLAFGPDGRAAMVTIVASGGAVSLDVIAEHTTEYSFTTNPILGDVDRDGVTDIIIGGTNAVYAFNHQFIVKSGFPITVSDRYRNDDMVSAPIMADVQNGEQVEIVFPTQNGNIWSMGPDVSFGFPLSGGEMGIGSPVVFNDTTGGKLGYLGLDGWFYCWRVDTDTVANFWPMFGSDPTGSFAFDPSKLGDVVTSSSRFSEDRFYNYPNPVVDGRTTIRYYLGEPADRVELTIYDMSGELHQSFEGSVHGGVDNEIAWDCGGLTPGVYRCIIEVEFGGETETAFKDIAIIR